MHPYFARITYFKLGGVAKLPLSFLVFFCILLFTSCACYKIPTASLLTETGDPCLDQQRRLAANHWLYRMIPRHRCQIRWYDLGHWAAWALFGNDDDGIFGEDADPAYLPCQKNSCWKALKWTCRNPLHNFCFYTIGSAHCQNSELTLLSISSSGIKCCEYHPIGSTNFNCPFGGFYLGLHGWKPFVSLHLSYTPQHVGEFYFGWRNRGNFGIKFCPLVKRKAN